jgi:hypothetical protein
VADHTDPISAPPVDPDIVEPAHRALRVRPWAIAAAGVVMIHGVSRDMQLKTWVSDSAATTPRSAPPRRNDPTDSTPPLLGRDGQCGRHPVGHRHRRSGGCGGGRAVRRTR